MNIKKHLNPRQIHLTHVKALYKKLHMLCMSSANATQQVFTTRGADATDRQTKRSETKRSEFVGAKD